MTFTNADGCLRLVVVERHGHPDEAQRNVCQRVGVTPAAVEPDQVVGVGPMDGLPVNGLRHPPAGQASEWYLWAGGEIDRSDSSFFRPIHATHLLKLHPTVVQYLALPPGWRFQIARDHEDIWFDPSLVEIE
jgi:hypothetical protein